MKLLETILLATDFSDASDDATKAAINLAKAFGSKILMIHVLPDSKESPIPLDVVKKVAGNELRTTVRAINDAGVATGEPIIAFGSPFDQIIHFAELHDVNVIVIGSGQKHPRGKHTLGVTAEKLVRKSSKPVWVVRPGTKKNINKILCPVDFSEASHRALSNAVHLCRKFGAKLTILTVFEPLVNIYRIPVKVSAKEQKNTEKHQALQFNKFLAGFDLQSVPWKKEICRGKPHEQILSRVKALKPDLIVMGSAGKSGVARILLGSVAEKVVREIPCSVITVKSEHAIRLRLEAEIADIEDHIEEGKKLLEGGFLEEALNQFQMVIAKDITFVPAWEGLAAVHNRLGHDEEAERCRQEAAYIRKNLWEKKVAAEIRSQHPLWKGKK